MNHKNFTLVLIFTLLGIGIFSCSTVDQNSEFDIPHINLVQIAEETGSILLSEQAKEISYIRLETTPNCVISQPVFIIRKEKVFVLDLKNEKMYLFNTSGDFIRQISSKGKGPQEYIGGRDMHVSSNGDTIHLLSTPMRTIYRFTDSGEKIGATKIPYTSWKLAPLQNGNYFILTPYGYSHPDSAQFLFYIQDKDGRVMFKDHTTPNVTFNGIFDLGNFYSTPLNTLVQHPYSDSVYKLSEVGKMKPCYVLDFGKYKTPKELFSDKNKYREVVTEYAYWISLVETEKAVFTSFYNRRVKRTGIYSLNEKAGSRLKITNGALLNDIDGGPDFWPRKSDGEKMIYSFIQPLKLIEDYQNGDFENKSFNDKKAREKFINLVKDLKESDNPIIMVVKLK